MKHVKLSDLRVMAARQLENAGNWPTTLPLQLELRITPPPYDFESVPGVVAMRPMLQLGEGDSAEYFDSVELDVPSEFTVYIHVPNEGGNVHFCPVAIFCRDPDAPGIKGPYKSYNLAGASDLFVIIREEDGSPTTRILPIWPKVSKATSEVKVVIDFSS